MLRRYLHEVGSDWIALVSGGASFVLMFVAAVFPNLPAWLVWPVAYLCLACAGYRVWAREYQAHADTKTRLAPPPKTPLQMHYLKKVDSYLDKLETLAAALAANDQTVHRDHVSSLTSEVDRVFLETEYKPLFISYADLTDDVLAIPAALDDAGRNLYRKVAKRIIRLKEVHRGLA